MSGQVTRRERAIRTIPFPRLVETVKELEDLSNYTVIRDSMHKILQACDEAPGTRLWEQMGDPRRFHSASVTLPAVILSINAAELSAHYQDDAVTLYHSDCLDALRNLPDNSVHAIVTDPPYGLANTDPVHVTKTLLKWSNGERDYIPGGAGFMGKAWDSFVPPVAVWDECLRVLKPGGHLLAFAGSRTHDLMGLSIRMAGFEIRDSIAWLYGSGFPKSLDVSKAIDKAAGAMRGVVGSKLGQPGYSLAPSTGENLYAGSFGGTGDPEKESQITAPSTPDAVTWQGWGTALKPAHEPIVVGRKPFAGTVAANVLAHGTGGINVDGCRVQYVNDADREQTRVPEPIQHNDARGVYQAGNGVGRTGSIFEPATAGRWPPNVVLDGSQADTLDDMTKGQGGASRFFPVFRYGPKAPKSERPEVDGVKHPTVKPLDLMRWLVRLVTPPGGTVLDPFAGSGTTAEACVIEGFKCIVIEREAEYLPLIVQRITKPSLQTRRET